MLYLKTAAAGVNGFIGAFGIGKTTSSAFTAGVASVRAPVDDVALESWIYWTPIQLLSGGIIDASAATDEDIVNSRSAVVRIDVDTKAMRKLDTLDLVFASLQVTEIGTATMNWAFDSRMLLKLH